MAQRLLHRLLLAISFDNPNGTATVTQTSFGNFFWQSQWHSDCYTDFFWHSLLTIPMAQRLLHRLLLAIFFDNPNGTATVTQTSFGNLFWQSQWHSDCYTDFFWQSFLTIPVAQQLLHRLLLAISFDNPNGTATVTQTSFGNFFWQSQWHSDCYTDFFWQSFSTIPMAQRQLHRLLLAIFFDNPNGTACAIYIVFVDCPCISIPHGTATITSSSSDTPGCDNPNGTACAIKLLKASVSSMFSSSSYTRPSDQTQRPRLVLVKGPCSQPANTLHPNAQVIATCPLDWHFPMEGRRYNLKSGRTLQQSTTQWNASDPESAHKSAKQKVYCTQQQYRGHTSLLRKHKECKRKSAKATNVLRTTAKNDAWTTAG